MFLFLHTIRCHECSEALSVVFSVVSFRDHCQKFTPTRGVECIVSLVAFVIGEHKGCAARGVGSKPPRLPNISLSGK